MFSAREVLRYHGSPAVTGGSMADFLGDGSDGAFNSATILANGTTAPNGGTVANLYDMNAATLFTTNNLPAAANQVVFQIDFGIPVYLSNKYTSPFDNRFTFWQVKISAGANRVIAWQASSDGSAWTEVYSYATGITTTATDSRFSITSGTPMYRYWRVVLKAGGSDCTFSCQGVTLNHDVSTRSTDLQTNLVWRVLYPVASQGDLIVKQLTSLTLPAGYNMAAEYPCRGLVIYVQGDVSISGSIDMSLRAGLAPNGEIVPILVTKKGVYNAKTSLLMHMNSAFTDAQGRTWTSGGAGQTWDTANFKFGTASTKFDGTATAYMDTPPSDDFSFGADDFTIDFWYRPTTVTANQYLCGSTDSSGNGANGPIRIYAGSDGKIYANLFQGQGGVLLGSSTALTVNTWYHMAVVRQGVKAILYINGVAEQTASISGALNRCAYKFAIGRWGESTTYPVNGNIDEFRVIKGKAMYTANFTPQTAEYTYQATYSDVRDMLTKFLQTTTVLTPLRGGYGGNGGYGGGHNTNTARSNGGFGGGGRINAGGFGGGGGGGNAAGTAGSNGGDIEYAELGGGKRVPGVLAAGIGIAPPWSYCGAGGTGAAYTNTNTITAGSGNAGACLGGGGGGSGGVASTSANVSGLSALDGGYAGGMISLVAGGNVTVNAGGSIKADGGAGGSGSDGRDSGNQYGAGGGGGGGAGGGVVAVYYKGTYTNNGSITANGGAGGTGGAKSTNATITFEAGAPGTSGSAGTIFTQKL